MLKVILDSLDGLDEKYHDLYEEKDGKFVLKLEGVDSHPAVVALKNGHTNSKRERDEAKRLLAEAKKKLEAVPEDFDADEWARLRAEDEARQNDPEGKDVRAQLDRQRDSLTRQHDAKTAALKKTHATELAEVVADRDGMEADLRRALVDDGLTKALVKAGVKPTLLKAAKRLFDSDVEVVVEDGVRVARMKSDIGGGAVEEFIANWSSSDDAKDFIAPPTGDDERGSKQSRGLIGDNPFGKNSWNKTAQAQLIKSNRAKAEQMAKAAGFKSLDQTYAARGPIAA